MSNNNTNNQVKNNMYKNFFLWLPINKDFFGFSDFDKAPLNILSELQHDTEVILYNRIKDILSKQKDIKYIIDDKSKSEFEYSRILKHNIINSENINIGTLCVYSNGLYLWTFNNEKTIDNFKKIYLYKLFATEVLINIINKNEELNKYEGLLNYPQIEIIFSGLFNNLIPPSLYFDIANDKSKEEMKKKLSIKNILDSILLYGSSEDFFSLSNRETYSCTKCNNNDKMYFFFASSMEQFIRVANTFSLEHYKRGLKFCISQLSTHGLLRAYSDTSDINHFFPPSLSSKKTTITSLESYQALVFEKIPIIEYMYQLFEGLYITAKNSSKYTKEPEYLKKLHQSIRQYRRRLYVINSYFKNIEDSLEIENQKSISRELSEIRKHVEISNEINTNSIVNLQEHMNKKNTDNNNNLMLLLAVFTLFITIVSPIVQFIIEKKDNTLRSLIDNVGFDFLSFFILIFVSICLYYIWKEYTKKCDQTTNNLLQSRHIFDNYSPTNKNAANKGMFTKLISFFHTKNYINNLPSLIDDDKRISCIKIDTLQERFNTYKKYTFSLYSEEESGIKYILHIDIHYDFFESEAMNAFKIEDVRMIVIKGNTEISYEDIHKKSHEIKKNLNSDFIDWLGTNSDNIMN